MRSITAAGLGLAACLLPLAASIAADAEQPATRGQPWVIASAGTFALVEEFDYPYLFGLQYRGRPRTGWALQPGIGVSAGRDGMGYFYGDVAHDFTLPGEWTLTLSLAAGHFINGDGIGAGAHLEFQSGIAFLRRLPGGARLGLAGYHVSNGGLDRRNNGSEALVLLLALPVGPSP